VSLSANLVKTSNFPEQLSPPILVYGHLNAKILSWKSSPRLISAWPGLMAKAGSRASSTTALVLLEHLGAASKLG